jgi:hypothetical protein
VALFQARWSGLGFPDPLFREQVAFVKELLSNRNMLFVSLCHHSSAESEEIRRHRAKCTFQKVVLKSTSDMGSHFFGRPKIPFFGTKFLPIIIDGQWKK